MLTKIDAIEDVKHFIANVENTGIRITRAYLFGSYAAGITSQHSDIDVALVSPDFVGFRFDDLGKIARGKIRSNPDIEAHTFTEEEFNESNPFARQIMQTGIPVL